MDMALGKDYPGQDCGLARALEVVGERWTMLVLRDAFYGVRRFNDFLAHLEAPRAVLADRLSALVDAGVLEKRRYSASPPRHEYVLTAAGRELWPVLHTLGRWGARHLSDAGDFRLFHHVTCGRRLDKSGWCPGCERLVPPGDVEIRPGPAADLGREDPVSVALRRPHRLLTPIPA
jgi:DNA-binding HxlR family transcriptional regulator